MQSFIAELVRVIIEPASQKKLFGDRYLTLARYLGCYEQAFESGAVLGHAFSDRLATFAQLFCNPGQEQELADALKQQAQKHFIARGEPGSFFDLAMWYEKSRAEDMWRKAGESEDEIDRLIDSYKVPLNDAFAWLQETVGTGIGFGGMYPRQTEKMWRDAYETKEDAATLGMLRRAGLSTGATASLGALPLAEQQEKLLSLVKSFISKSRPDMLPEFQ